MLVKTYSVRSILPFACLLAQAYFTTPTSAAFVDSKYAVNLRPRSLEYAQRSHSEMSSLKARQNTLSCGDAAGRAQDTASLVASSANAGLPHASDTGVVFMQASISSPDLCGPYTCYVSSDASGSSWTPMTLLQGVPSIEEGCAVDNATNVYPLVARFPDDTSCTGSGGACLVMCKSENMPLGNCAAVAWRTDTTSSSEDINPESSASASSALEASSTAQLSTTTVTTQVDSTSVRTIIQTIPVRQGSTTAQALPTTSSAASSASSSSRSKAAVTLQGFSGDNGPGGPAEQHLIFGLSVSSAEDGISATSAAPRGLFRVEVGHYSMAFLAMLAVLTFLQV